MSLYQVQAILDRRYNSRTKRYEYKIKWEGYPDEEATWQPETNLVTVREMLKQFMAAHSKGKNNGYVKGEQKQKEEHQENLSFSVSHYLRSNKQQSYGVSQQSARVKLKNKPIKKDKPLAKRKISQMQKQQQLFDGQEGEEMKQPIEDKDMPLQGQEKAIYQPNNHQIVQPTQHATIQANQKIDQQLQQQDEQSLQEVLDIAAEPQKAEDNRSFVIKEICRTNQVFLYIVYDKGQMRWASKNEILREHPLALIQFYQSRIKYFPIRKVQTLIPAPPHII